MVQRSGHEEQPAVSRELADGEAGVAHAESGMAAGFDVGRRAAETEDQEVAEALLCCFQIERRVHRAQDVVAGDLAVEGSY